MQKMTIRSGVLGLMCGALATTPALADQFGNPTVVGKPDALQVSLGGGKSSNLQLDSDRTSATTTIGNVTGTSVVAPSSATYRDVEQAFASVSYTVDQRLQLSAHLGSGRDPAAGGYPPNPQKSTSYGLGLKLVSQGSGGMKMGLMLRMQRFKVDTQGTLFAPYANSRVNDGVNTTNFYQPVTGTDALRYTRYDLFVGASTDEGTVRPYGGFAYTKIAGTDTLALNGSTPTMTCPNAGGACTFTTQNASYTSQANVSNAKMFSAVVGLDINPESPMGLTIEARGGVQSQVTAAFNLRF